MIGKYSKSVCPVEQAGALDNGFRSLLQNPEKILKPYIREGMTALDVGCGPGFFSIEIAKLVGQQGKVFAADLQEGMLQKLSKKVKETELEKRIVLHKCDEKGIGISEQVDFVIAFYMIHEVPDQQNILREMQSILKPDGKMFIAEPKFHVSKRGFEDTVKLAQKIGFKVIEHPKVFFSHTVILVNSLADKEA